MMQEIGNSRARAVYEANIPDHFRRPQTDSSLEAFIRAKYERKKYIAKEWIPPTPSSLHLRVSFVIISICIKDSFCHATIWMKNYGHNLLSLSLYNVKYCSNCSNFLQLQLNVVQ